MNKALIEAIPYEFSKYQRDVAIALLENFQTEHQTVTWQPTKLLTKTNLKIQTGKTRSTLKTSFIEVKVEVVFFTQDDFYILPIFQEWHKPFLPWVNVLSARRSMLLDISFLIAHPTAPDSERIIDKYCKIDYSLPDNLRGAPRAIAQFLSDNFNWDQKEDNEHGIKPINFDDDLVPGVKIIITANKWQSKTSKLEQTTILFKTDNCLFSRKFTAKWQSPSTRQTNNYSIAKTILQFTKAQIMREGQKSA